MLGDQVTKCLLADLMVMQFSRFAEISKAATGTCGFSTVSTRTVEVSTPAPETLTALLFSSEPAN